MRKLVAALAIALTLGASNVWAQCREAGPIRFERGRTTGVVKGRVTSARNVCYTVRARAGQRMTVHVTSPGKRVRFNVAGVGDGDVAQIEGAYDVTDWEGELTFGDDYVISVGVPKGADTFTLEVTIR